MCTLSNYWKLLSQRASGKVNTNAHWMREFILRHPDYKQDSRVPDTAVYDLMVAIDKIQKGEKKEPAMYVDGGIKTKTSDFK